MTTGNELASPQTRDDATVQTESVNLNVDEIVDPDEIELRDARSAAQAEEAAAQAKTQAEDGKKQEPASGNAAADQKALAPAETAGPERIMIPKERLDEVLAKLAKSEQDAAYYRGMAEASRAATAKEDGKPATTAAPSPQQRMESIREEIEALAKKFDEGEITMSEFKRQEKTLIDREQEIREEMLIAKIKTSGPTPPQTRGGDELYLETLTAQLEQDHPWVMVFEQVGTQADWDYLKARAIEQLAARNVTPSNTAVGIYELRREMAEMADMIGPHLLSARAKAKGIPIPGQSQEEQKTDATSRISRQVQARAAKLEMRTSAPPDLSAMSGSAGSAAGEPTAEQLERMSDEEIAALPDPVRRKLLGIAA